MNAKKQLKKVNTLRRIARNMKEELIHEVETAIADTIEHNVKSVRLDDRKLIIIFDEYADIKTRDIIKLQNLLGEGVIRDNRYYISE